MSSRITVFTLSFLLVAFSLSGQQSSAPRKKPTSTTAKSAHARTALQKKKKAKKTLKTSPAHSRKLHRAFVASATLKPMAKQLLADRTPAAYAGVQGYARLHAKEDGGALALLVLGQAHLLDSQDQEAIVPLSQASARGGELGDYADYLVATAYQHLGNKSKVATVLKGFATKYPDSLFIRDAALMRAYAVLGSGDPAEAIKILEAVGQPTRADIELAMGRAYAAEGDSGRAAAIFNQIYCEMPLSAEAGAANTELQSLNSRGFVAAPTYEQRRTRADLLMKAHHYSDAAQEYKNLLDSIRSDLNQANEQRALQVKYAGALYHTGRKSEARPLLEAIAQSEDESDAERLYYLHEIARNNDDGDQERKLLAEIMQRHPQSPWLQETLFSAANMYLLRKDTEHAIEYYSEEYKLFPDKHYAPYSHWKAAWLSLRGGKNDDARHLFEEQIQNYPGGQEIPAALYWRARLAEEDKDWNKAGAYYTTLIQRYKNFYYAHRARERLKFAFDSAQDDPILEKVSPPVESKWNFDPPADSLRLQRSRLLRNGALFDFAVRELQAASEEEESDSVWAQLEIARVYIDADRNDRALQTLKHAVPNYFAVDLTAMPKPIWEVLFPRPYWSDLTRYAAANGLDPYLVASLIRQESEFNPAAVSSADAYGLMQLLPHVGKQLAKEVKIRHFSTSDLTNPTINLQLGTRYFKELVNEFNGQVEYALAAYNAGDDRVRDWRSAGNYRDITEFVESIPFSETREYVQAIMRNAVIYRSLYGEDNPPSRTMRAARNTLR